MKKALEAKDYVAMAVNEVKGRGEQKVIILQFRGGKMSVDLLPKIEIFLVKNNIDAVVETITQNARTGRYGDGKIFILPVEKSIRIRTGEIEF